MCLCYSSTGRPQKSDLDILVANVNGTSGIYWFYCKKLNCNCHNLGVVLFLGHSVVLFCTCVNCEAQTVCNITRAHSFLQATEFHHFHGIWSWEVTVSLAILNLAELNLHTRTCPRYSLFLCWYGPTNYTVLPHCMKSLFVRCCCCKQTKCTCSSVTLQRLASSQSSCIFNGWKQIVFFMQL